MSDAGLNYSKVDNTQILLGALASNDLISVQQGQASKEDLKLLHCKYFFSFLPGGSDGFEGPIIVGWAPGDMTDAEIEEAIEANPLVDNDYPAIEQSQRPFFPLEILLNIQETTNLNNLGGRLVAQGEFKPRWRIQELTGWRWFAYNMSGAALATGGIVEVWAKWFGVWLP